MVVGICAAHVPGSEGSAEGRIEYPFGVASYAGTGWSSDTTSTGWTRQAPIASRVAFAPHVRLALGWPTLGAQIDPGDPVLWGGQRAQVFTTETALRERAELPLMTERGDSAWYGFVFRTSARYVPQKTMPYPNWNGVFSWHDGGYACGPAHCWAPQANISVSIATAVPRDGHWRFLVQPRISIEVYGGDVHDKEWWHHGHRWYTVRFVPGRRYEIAMGVKWGDSGDGSIEVWINGRRVVAQSGLSTLWQGLGVFPLFENYRPPGSDAAIRAANTVYYAGLVRGATRSQVSMPRG
jgi:hypothetical protein